MHSWLRIEILNNNNNLDNNKKHCAWLSYWYMFLLLWMVRHMLCGVAISVMTLAALWSVWRKEVVKATLWGDFHCGDERILILWLALCAHSRIHSVIHINWNHTNFITINLQSPAACNTCTGIKVPSQACSHIIRINFLGSVYAHACMIVEASWCNNYTQEVLKIIETKQE